MSKPTSQRIISRQIIWGFLCAFSLFAVVASIGNVSATTQPDEDPIQPRSVPELKMRGIALPSSWKAKPVTHAGTHNDAEWQSPAGTTVFGAVYVHAPFFTSGRELIKSIKADYARRQPGGKITQQWTDASGRNWFEVDADGTHTKAFVIAHGRHAWFVYYRYGTEGRSPQKEIDIADHAINQVEPIDGE